MTGLMDIIGGLKMKKKWVRSSLLAIICLVFAGFLTISCDYETEPASDSITILWEGG